MAHVTYRTPVSGTTVAWAGDEFSREHVLPGGGMLYAADFAAVPAHDNRKFVESGILVGRTYAERDAGQGFGPYAAGDNEVYLLLHDVLDAAVDPSATLYRPGSLVYETKLPADTQAQLAVVRANFQTSKR